MPAENNNSSASLYDRLISVLHTFYVDLRKNAVLFFCCLLLGILAFVFVNVRKAGIYHASFTVMYEELVRKVYGDRLEKLNSLLRENKPKAVTLLGVSEKAASSLKSVEGENILGEDLNKDLNTDRIPFVVNIYLNDTTYVPELQDGILHYLEEGNSYLSDKRKIKIKEIEDEIAFIDNQLLMMDSLKRRYNSMGGIVTTSSSTTTTTTTEGTVYSFSYELYKKKQELLKKKEMPMNLYVIDDAIVPVKSNRSYALVALVGFIAGAFLYLFIAYIVIPVTRYNKA